jgi:hypothetical protein
LETVELPGFLKGKFYGDFTDPTKYKESLSLLIRSLGPSAELINQSDGQLAQLRIELNDAKKVVAQHEKELQKHQRTALRGKSDKLVAAITAANVKHPTHAPINITHAFEVCGQPITLDYLLWAIQKASYRGGHPLEALFTVDKKWPEVDSMIDAYIDLLSFEESK